MVETKIMIFLQFHSVLKGIYANCPLTPPIQQHRPNTIHPLRRVHTDIGKSNSRTFRDFFLGT
jgi:hypothetical protein